MENQKRQWWKTVYACSSPDTLENIDTYFQELNYIKGIEKEIRKERKEGDLYEQNKRTVVKTA